MLYKSVFHLRLRYPSYETQVCGQRNPPAEKGKGITNLFIIKESLLKPLVFSNQIFYGLRRIIVFIIDHYFILYEAKFH